MTRLEQEPRTMDARQSVHQGMVLAVSLAVLWLALSGHYTGLLLSLGLGCVALCVWIAARMEILDDDFEYPVGGDAVLSNYGPSASLTTTLSATVAGTYKVRVTVTDSSLLIAARTLSKPSWFRSSP